MQLLANVENASNVEMKVRPPIEFFAPNAVMDQS